MLCDQDKHANVNGLIHLHCLLYACPPGGRIRQTCDHASQTSKILGRDDPRRPPILHYCVSLIFSTLALCQLICIIRLLANIPPAAVLALNLNPIMNVIFDFPSGVVFVVSVRRSVTGI